MSITQEIGRYPAPAGQRILLIRLGGFGDVVFTLPAVHLLRSRYPNARTTFLVYHEFAPLLEGFPGVDRVLTLERARFRSVNPLKICSHAGSLLGSLVGGRFDLTVDFQGFGETAFFSWSTRAPQRWGSVYRPGRQWAYTHGVQRNPQLHPIEYHLDLLRHAGGLDPAVIRNEFIPPQKDLLQAQEFFARNKLDSGRPTLFIQPFTSTEPKTWPLERYLASAQLWRSRGLQILFGGGPGDRARLEPARTAGFAVAAGASPLLSAALVKLSTLVLGGDTGLLHLAVAMGKRVIMIIRSVQPGACIPFGHRDWTIVPPPGLHVSAVTFEEVNQACQQALSELRIGLNP
jgi:ADP-heptose:LPS heptosyltransferase